ncbi:MAG: FtsW/RodA/SpoVE family cell cycle protein [Slackia sp.]
MAWGISGETPHSLGCRSRGRGVIGLAGYRSHRISVWLEPWDDGEGDTVPYQTIRSFYAFAEGGIFGVGLGNSREKFLYLPEAETDFIFSIIGEELGLIGALFVIALFMVVLFAGLRIAHHAPDNFGCMMAGSLTVMLVAQALEYGMRHGPSSHDGQAAPVHFVGGSSILASCQVGFDHVGLGSSNTLTSHERRRNDLNASGLMTSVPGARDARGQ